MNQMKYLLPVVILFAVAVSCKKKETNHFSDASVSKGDFLILVVSDSLECAMEYHEDTNPSFGMSESPVYTTAEFNGGNYDVTIYVKGVGMYGFYELNVVGCYCVVDFPIFQEYYLDTFIDSIPANQLDKNAVYQVELDTSKIDFVMAAYPDKLEAAWDKVKNLRILYEYRMKYPASKIAFLHVVKENGEEKSYFFINKYKP